MGPRTVSKENSLRLGQKNPEAPEAQPDLTNQWFSHIISHFLALIVGF
jgi:hypothetical protein